MKDFYEKNHRRKVGDVFDKRINGKTERVKLENFAGQGAYNVRRIRDGALYRVSGRITYRIEEAPSR